MPQHIVIIGAVSLGPKVASRFKRLEPDSRVTIVDQESLVSYSCGGIPYYVSGEATAPEAIIQNNFQTLRDEKYYDNVIGAQLFRNTKARSLDRHNRTVVLEDLFSGEARTVHYDQLVLATGKRPKPLSLPNAHLDGVIDVYSLKSAVAVRERIVHPGVNKAVILGGGLTGIETAEALSDMWEVETTVIELEDQLLPYDLSSDMAKVVKHHLEEKGITVLLKERILRIEGDGSVERIVTDQRTLEAELLIVATGVQPNAELAKQAGLVISPGGAVAVDERMRTSDPFIYAGGDCVETVDPITQGLIYRPWPSIAQRQGRVIATNLAGGEASFPACVVNIATKVFDLPVAFAGLSIHGALQAGFDAVSVAVAQLERAHFWHQKDYMYLELVVEKGTGRVLGIQGFGDSGDGLVGRVNTVAAILPNRPTATDIGNLNIAYAPPFSGAMDIVNTLGNVAENLLFGRGEVMHPRDFLSIWRRRGKSDWVILDTRYSHEAETFSQKYGDIWKSISLTELMDRKAEIPKDKRFLVLCKTGERSYDSQVFLNHLGVRESYNLQGGIAYLQKCGIIQDDEIVA